MRLLQWLTRLRYRLATFHDYGNRLNRSVDVENALMQVATGKRDLLTPDECRKLALKLGVPDCYRSKEPDPATICSTCANCGKPVRGLNNAPEILEHIQTDRRSCDDGTNAVADTPPLVVTAYGDFTLPWRHDHFTHPTWGHVVHRVLSADNCEVYYGSAELCLKIVEASQGTDADRYDCVAWHHLPLYVQAKFELAKTKDA